MQDNDRPGTSRSRFFDPHEAVRKAYFHVFVTSHITVRISTGQCPICLQRSDKVKHAMHEAMCYG